jgi:hypothetical protein
MAWDHGLGYLVRGASEIDHITLAWYTNARIKIDPSMKHSSGRRQLRDLLLDPDNV